jgi:hypothetical protein
MYHFYFSFILLNDINLFEKISPLVHMDFNFKSILCIIIIFILRFKKTTVFYLLLIHGPRSLDIFLHHTRDLEKTQILKKSFVFYFDFLSLLKNSFINLYLSIFAFSHSFH